jgi:hypothetical protein
MIGTWTGYYKYDKKVPQTMVRHDQTNFTIIIQSFDGKFFKGIVKDDLSTGGMEGEGQIIGQVENGKVSFKKLMPRRTLVYRDGTRKVTNEKHPAIHYKGTVSPDRRKMEGKWEIKRRIAFLFGLIPFPYKPPPGTWSMTLQ